jgi:hypothetical protein
MIPRFVLTDLMRLRTGIADSEPRSLGYPIAVSPPAPELRIYR